MKTKRTKKYKPKRVKIAMPIDAATIDQLMLQLHFAIQITCLNHNADQLTRVGWAAKMVSHHLKGLEPISRSVVLWHEKKSQFPRTPTPVKLLHRFALICESTLRGMTVQDFLDSKGYVTNEP